jgi:hypothetical protein
MRNTIPLRIFEPIPIAGLPIEEIAMESIAHKPVCSALPISRKKILTLTLS